jgi:RNA polymerase sigma-70 factor, ECF subfamily
VDGRSKSDAGSTAEQDARHDAEWLPLLRQARAEALHAIYERYRVRIYSFLLRLCGRRDLADDLLQDTFVQLARHAARLPETTHLAPWLFTVARNRYLSQRRTTLSRLEQLRVWWGGDRVDVALFPSPQQVAAGKQSIARLEHAIQMLSPSLREVVLLVCVEDLPQDEAAVILGIQPAALRKRLERGRAQIQAFLEEQERGRDHGPVDG